MSRCFPYPPPGFNGDRASDQALIESIKLQREKEKTKTKRKKGKKMEKKERREKKENKEKAKLASTAIGHDEYSHRGEKSWPEVRGEWSKDKRRLEDAEQLERSGLTEEHEQPVDGHNPCYSSDSTQNNKKRSRQEFPENGNCGHGSTIRTRLPLQKHQEPDASSSKEQLCATSGRAYLPGHRGHDSSSSDRIEHTSSTSVETDNAANVLQFVPEKELSSNFRKTKTSAQDAQQIASGFIPVVSEVKKMNSYNRLIQNLVQLALPSEITGFDDDEWLFGRKHSARNLEKRFKVNGSDGSCCSSSALWLHANYLPEAQIFALPYAVPF